MPKASSIPVGGVEQLEKPLSSCPMRLFPVRRLQFSFTVLGAACLLAATISAIT